MNKYEYVSKLGKNIGALEELSRLVDWVRGYTNPNLTKMDLSKYWDNRLLVLSEIGKTTWEDIKQATENK